MITLTRIMRYFKENLGAPFIICFQILLIVCASFIALGRQELANKVATYSFYLLIIGVVLQIISPLVKRKRGYA